MKKTLKKLVCLIMALICAFTLVSCGGDKAKAKKTVENFLEATAKLDYEKAAEYLDDDSVIPEEVKMLTDEEAFAEQNPEMEDYAKDFIDVFKKLAKKIDKNSKHKIESVEEDDDGYIVTVVSEAPTMDVFEDAMQDAVEKLQESGEDLSDMSEEEGMELLIEMLGEVVDEIEFDDIEETENEYYVVEVDGKWVIDTEKTEIQ